MPWDEVLDWLRSANPYHMLPLLPQGFKRTFTSIIQLPVQRQMQLNDAQSSLGSLDLEVLKAETASTDCQNFAVGDVVAFTFHMNEKGQPRAAATAEPSRANVRLLVTRF